MTNLDVDVLQRVGIALDRRLEIRFGRDALEQPVDAGHLAMQELVLRVGRACGYDGSFELPTRPAEPWRSVDVGLASPQRRILILNECWNTFGDVGASARSSARKVNELENPRNRAMGRRGAGGPRVGGAGNGARALVARYPEIFASRFPGSSRGWIAALTTGAPPPAEPGFVWCDVAATRLLEWRRPS